MKVLFTYDYGKEQMEILRSLGYEVMYIYENQVANSPEVDDVDVLVCYNPFNKLDITKMKNLKWIQLSSIGIDQAPIEYIKENNIKLTNNKGGYSIPMGEWIVLNILQIYKNSMTFHEKQKRKKWKTDMQILEIYQKTIGFIGTGTIAVEAAKRLQGFGVNLVGLNTDGRDVLFFKKCFAMEEMNQFLQMCDVVVLSIPYTEKTHHLINEERLRMMRDDSVLINISRGSIVDEKALIEEIGNGKFLGVALDVFEEEPLSKLSPLWDFPNVYITPHNSWVSEMRNSRRYKVNYENLRRFINNEELLNLIDFEKGY